MTCLSLLFVIPPEHGALLYQVLPRLEVHGVPLDRCTLYQYLLILPLFNQTPILTIHQASLLHTMLQSGVPDAVYELSTATSRSA
ncbi:uncharacterized protein EDB91DRAFT_1170392 [Suillus paluster]|uniref:uncharacterized protein n=1 Tax=Suillus paluster TaxID=48578 RepID=UPI001B88171F|nr:uncharacterized protein EDB91DRAFT_1170392 [Suillus paluster]KAG1724628.1 hypothetical protein EDB91DRAFT_1170392 [Suillus paluster]